ncbi:MAG: sodium:solute symporter family protein [Clostridiales bacterium]|nr:sodium:solute symporter family protein [Clostridiales bacterium]
MTTMWITIAVYIAVLVFIAIYTGRNSKSLSDFTVGGRNAGAWLSALSYGAAYFSAVMFVGYAGNTGYSFGLWGILAGLGNAIFGSWLAWRVLARRTRDVAHRLKIKTMPQFFEQRFESSGIKMFACIVIFIFLVPYSASVYKGLASISKVLLNIPETPFMIIIALLAVLLLVFGGYLVQSRADFVQGIIMMFGVTLLIIFVVRSKQVDGLAGLKEYAKSAEGLPKLTGSKWVSLMATVLMTSFGTWGLPQMIQKYFGIKDDAQAKRGITISTLFGFLVAVGGYFIGSLCYRFYTQSEMDAMGKDYIVPNILKDSMLPNVLLGVVLVLLIAASVSTLCSVTLTASSTLSIDFVKSIKKDFTDKKATLLTKIMCILFIIVSYLVANSDTAILDMMSYSWGIISGSFLAPYVLSLYYKGLNKIGAWASILTGFCIALVPATCKIMIDAGSVNETVKDLALKGPLFACIAIVASLIVCVAVSAATNKGKKIDNEFFYNGVIENE